MSTSPLRPEDTPFGPPTKFCVWAKFTDVINCAKFHLHWLSRFWAPGVRKPPFPIDLRYRSYNSVCTNVLHYDFCDVIWNALYEYLVSFLGSIDARTWRGYRLYGPHWQFLSGDGVVVAVIKTKLVTFHWHTFMVIQRLGRTTAKLAEVT